MRWSKLKKLISDKVAPSVSGRFAINSTAYGHCSCGHAWITIDKEIIANFCTRAFWNRCPQHFDSASQSWQHEGPNPLGLPPAQAAFYEQQAVEYGDLSRQDVYRSCWAFIHELRIGFRITDDFVFKIACYLRLFGNNLTTVIL